MSEIKAPKPYKTTLDIPTVFLAGSIEMGVAEKWQDRVVKHFEDGDTVLFLNPRRDDWDSSWVQSIENDQFRTQVQWELNGLRNADIVVVYFDPATTSPITLLELGTLTGYEPIDKQIIVCCPKDYFRRGNVEITCDFYGIPMVETYEEMIHELQKYIDYYYD